MDHYTLTVKQGEVIGLELEDFETAELPPMAQAAFMAWHHIAMQGPWLASFTSSQMLERRNNPEIIVDGGMSYRIGKKFENELGISLKRMISLNVHSTADTEHSDMMDGVYDKHVLTQEDYDTVLRAAGQCMAIDRAYRGGMAYVMRRIEGDPPLGACIGRWRHAGAGGFETRPYIGRRDFGGARVCGGQDICVRGQDKM